MKYVLKKELWDPFQQKNIASSIAAVAFIEGKKPWEIECTASWSKPAAGPRKEEIRGNPYFAKLTFVISFLCIVFVEANGRCFCRRFFSQVRSKDIIRVSLNELPLKPFETDKLPSWNSWGRESFLRELLLPQPQSVKRRHSQRNSKKKERKKNTSPWLFWSSKAMAYGGKEDALSSKLPWRNGSSP